MTKKRARPVCDECGQPLEPAGIADPIRLYDTASVAHWCPECDAEEAFTGGSFFPALSVGSSDGEWSAEMVGGLTVRDFLAAAALIGLPSASSQHAELASRAYGMADAMMAARREEDPDEEEDEPE